MPIKFLLFLPIYCIACKNKYTEVLKMINLLITLLCGAVAGWLAGVIMGMNGGLLRNIIVGLLGGVVGGLLFNIIGIGGGSLLWSILTAVVGACLLLFLAKKILKWK